MSLAWGDRQRLAGAARSAVPAGRVGPAPSPRRPNEVQRRPLQPGMAPWVGLMMSDERRAAGSGWRPYRISAISPLLDVGTLPLLTGRGRLRPAGGGGGRCQRHWSVVSADEQPVELLVEGPAPLGLSL